MSDFSEDHDPYSIRRLEALGIRPGWACLDVGAGRGSLARWMKARAGPSGRVVAVDVDSERLLSGLDGTGVEALELDVTCEAPPAASFDLVHSRLMLCYLPDAEDVVARLVAAARPGRHVVLADLDFTSHRPVRGSAAWNRAWPAFLRGLVDAGWDPAFGRRLTRLLEEAGLVRVEAETIARYVRGGSATARQTIAALERMAHVVPDIAEEDLREVRALLADPDQAFVAPEYTIASGQRPGNDA